MVRYKGPCWILSTVGVLMAVFSMSKSTSVLKVREGQLVRMSCSFIGSEVYTTATWLRQISQSAPVAILTTSLSRKPPELNNTEYYNGFDNKHIRASMNYMMSTIIILSVSASDSGLYFCGAQPTGYMVYYNTTYLNITGERTPAPSVSKSTSVVVSEGQMVQLNCSVLGRGPGYTSVTWLRQTSQSAPVSIISPTFNEGFSANGPPSYYNGFSCYYMTASMTSSMSTLEIRSVSVSDSGLYFCGAKRGQHMMYYNTTYLNVTGTARVNDSGTAGEGVPGPSGTAGEGGFCSNMCVAVVLVLAVLSVLLNLILLLIIIIVKHRSGKTHMTVPGNQPSSPSEQARESESLTYAALNFSKKKKKQRRTNLQTDDPHVVYAATR